MAALKVLDVHAQPSTARPSSGERRTEQVLRRELDHSREAWGEILRVSCESAGVSIRGLAERLGVTETSVRRWISGETSAPLDLLDRLPATVADRFMMLARVRMHARTADRVAPADMMRALQISIATLTLAQAEGQDPRAALLKVADIAATLAARGLNDR